MSNLQLVTTEKFGEIDCNFYRNMNDDILLTREQIGSALEYSNPSKAIRKIHLSHKDRLEQMCLRINLGHPQFGANLSKSEEQERVYYTERGIMEICRWSRQPKANQFMDWCWDIIKKYRHGNLDTNNDTKMLLSIILEIQKQSNEINKTLTTLLTSSQPKEKYKSSFMPAWVSKMFPKFTKIREIYFPEDVENNKYINTFRKIFNDFNEMYGSELLAQTVDDFCYQNNCLKCNTMDAVAYTPDVRKVMEVFIDDMLLNVERSIV